LLNLWLKSALGCYDRSCRIYSNGCVNTGYLDAMSSTKIMIVEDEGIIALSLRSLLEDEGYEVVAIESLAESAIEQAELLKPDLVLMDINLAGAMDGIEAAGHIYTHQLIPVIFLSAYIDAETLKRVKSTQPFAFLSKPVDRKTLLTSIEISLNKHRSVYETTLALEEKTRLLSAFQAITQSMQSSLHLEHILDVLAEQIVHAGIFRSLMVALVDEAAQTAEVVRSVTRVGADGVLMSPYVNVESVGRRFGLADDDLTAKTARAGKMRVIEGTDERFDTSHLTSKQRTGQVFYFVPVVRDGSVVAVLATGSKSEDREEMLYKLRVMQPLLDQVAIALDHAQLHQSLQKKIVEIERINANYHQELTERRRAERALKEEYQLREAETALRVRVASIDEPQDLFALVEGISRQLHQLGVTHEHCSLQVVNKSGDDFISLSKENAFHTSRTWSKLADLSWDRDSGNMEDYPWIIEEWKKKETRYEPSNPRGNRLPEGISVLDVPFPHGTLALSTNTVHAFSDRDIEIAERLAGVISFESQRLDDIIARGRGEG
jgi:CheY-like chemotaxis protein